MADAHYLLGVCLREQHRVPEALQALEKAVALAPGMIPAREELADLYGSLDRRTDELEQLQMIAGLDRDHVGAAGGDRPGARARRPLGPRGAHAGRRARAQPERAARSTARSARSGSNARATIGAFLSKAREALERVASSPAATSETLTLYGRALLQEGDVDAAERALQQATTRFPIEPSALPAVRVDRREAEPPRRGAAGADSVRRPDVRTTPTSRRARRASPRCRCG